MSKIPATFAIFLQDIKHGNLIKDLDLSGLGLERNSFFLHKKQKKN